MMSKMIDRKFIGSVLQKVSNYGAQNSTNISRNIYLQQIVNEAVLYVYVGVLGFFSTCLLSVSTCLKFMGSSLLSANNLPSRIPDAPPF